MGKNKKVIYTSYFGNRGGIIEPSYISPGWDYVFFTDNEYIYDLSKKHLLTWKIEYIPTTTEETDSEIRAKFYKIVSHAFFPEYEYSIYIDSDKYKIDCNLDRFIENTLSPDSVFASLKHRKCDCTYKEIERQRKRKRDFDKNFDDIRDRCIDSGLPEHWGLNDNSIVVRKHCSELYIVMNNWWLEVAKYCKRDQCSLMKVLYESGLPFNQLEYEGFKNYKTMRYLSRISK